MLFKLCKLIKVGNKSRSFLFGQSAEIFDKAFIGIIFLAKVVEIGFVQLKGHVCFVCGNLLVVRIVDALPKFCVPVKDFRYFGFDFVNLTVELVCVFVGHAVIDSVNLLLKPCKLVKVGNKSRSFLFGQSVEISDKALNGRHTAVVGRLDGDDFR